MELGTGFKTALIERTLLLDSNNHFQRLDSQNPVLMCIFNLKTAPEPYHRARGRHSWDG